MTVFCQLTSEKDEENFNMRTLETSNRKKNKYTANDYDIGYHNWFQILAKAKS